MQVPYVDVGADNQPYKQQILDAFEEVLDSGDFILGEQVQRFEEEFAEFVGSGYAVGIGNGTDALVLALKALGVGPGDEVIVPANSYLTSGTSVSLVGATPVFCDVQEDQNIDLEFAQNLLSPSTAAVMVVHLGGRPCNMDKAREFAERNDLLLIEDCAQAAGASWKGRRVGSFGDVGCFSFHPLKNLGALGDGGMTVTGDPDIAQKLRLLRNHGKKNRDEAAIIGMASRLDTIQAAALRIKLASIEEVTQARQANAAQYITGLANLKGLDYVPSNDDSRECVYHMFVVQAQERDELQSFLAQRGISAKVHYPIPIHEQECFAHLPHQELPQVESQAQHILSLPIHQHLSTKQIKAVITSIKEFYDG